MLMKTLESVENLKRRGWRGSYTCAGGHATQVDGAAPVALQHAEAVLYAPVHHTGLDDK